MYDLETGAFCYITSMGGISCEHYSKFAITPRLQDLIHVESKKYKERKYDPPHMIIIDFPIKSEIKNKSEKKKGEKL